MRFSITTRHHKPHAARVSYKIMKRITLKHLSFLCVSLFLAQPTALPAADKTNDTASAGRDMVLWYRQPAEKWLEAMPVGDGYMGAMVFGGVQQERIALNESSFWSGRPHDYNDTNGINYFPQIRDLIFDGKFQEAEKMADDHFWGIPKAQQAYQPIGDLLLNFDGAEKVEDYRRELDLETGVAKTSYRVGDATF